MKSASKRRVADAGRRRLFRRRRGVRRIWIALAVLLAVWAASAAWQRSKPLPEGISVAAPVRSPVSVRLLVDYTYTDAEGERHIDQVIFDRVLELIDRAERLVVLDMFLFNHFAGDASGDDLRPLSREVTDALVRRRAERPELRAILITDPINTFYGSLELPQFQRLREAGVEVVVTDLDRLRASNPAWSGVWRLCCQWFGRGGSGWLPNPMGGSEVTLRSVLRLLRFKANHRKTLVADVGNDWVGLVTSGNPHDASSAHSNVAVEFSGAAALDLLATEGAVVAFSAPDLDWPNPLPAPDLASGAGGEARVQVLTESRIRDAVVDLLARASSGDRVDLAMFYLSHRDVIEALLQARERGAAVRALLDPNKDAFGRVKNGIPNRSVAAELVDGGVDVRWCDTHGEQCHDKAILVRFDDGSAEWIAGSANFTRRNLDDLNLETDVRVLAPAGAEFMRHAARYFERRWSESDGRNYSVPYRVYAEEGWLRYWRYRLMEATGLSTF